MKLIKHISRLFERTYNESLLSLLAHYDLTADKLRECFSHYVFEPQKGILEFVHLEKRLFTTSGLVTWGYSNEVFYNSNNGSIKELENTYTYPLPSVVKLSIIVEKNQWEDPRKVPWSRNKISGALSGLES